MTVSGSPFRRVAAVGSAANGGSVAKIFDFSYVAGWAAPNPTLRLAGVEVAHMIWKGQLDQSEQSGFAQFAALAGSFCPPVELPSTRRKLCETTLITAPAH